MTLGLSDRGLEDDASDPDGRFDEDVGDPTTIGMDDEDDGVDVVDDEHCCCCEGGGGPQPMRYFSSKEGFRMTLFNPKPEVVRVVFFPPTPTI